MLTPNRTRSANGVRLDGVRLDDQLPELPTLAATEFRESELNDSNNTNGEKGDIS